MATKGEDTKEEGATRPTKSRTHPLYKKLAVLNGEVNRLKSEEVKEKLSELGLSNQGTDPIIYKRYKQHCKRAVVSKDPSPPYEIAQSIVSNPLGLKYLLVLDFEATCEEVNPYDYIHEIIEYPVILLELENLKIVDEFHSYCRPCLNPQLSSFCMKLTGIKQSQVDNAPTFSEVFGRFSDWMRERELGTKHHFSLVTDCPWDIRNCLFPQCALANKVFPSYAAKWIDVRKLFGSFYQTNSGNLSYMLSQLGMEFEGREHCGMDDSRNIVRILRQLVLDGCVLHYNRFIPQDVISSVFKTKR